jgi:hypothetical protein
MDPLLYRSLLSINPNTNLPISTNFILSTDGFGDISWQNVLNNMSSQSIYIGYLPSTIRDLSNGIFDLKSCILQGSLTLCDLTSSLNGLGTMGYISSSQLISTINNLGSLGYVSSFTLQSTVSGLGNLGYLSTPYINSTIIGLGTFGYISSISLESTVRGLGSVGYISSISLESTVRGLASIGYISSVSLESTLRGLGTFGYVSSASLISTTIKLTDSINEIINNRNNINFIGANNVNINTSNTNVIISTLSTAYFYDSFFNSSIKYKGNNNAQTAYVPTTGPHINDFFFSTLDLQLNTCSNYIHGNTYASAEIYPNITFDSATLGTSNGLLVNVSSYISYNGAPTNIVNNSKFLIKNSNYSNIFKQPLRLNISGSNINCNYTYPYLLTHRIMNVSNYSGTGFNSKNLDLFFDSTSSYYLSIQNMTM